MRTLLYLVFALLSLLVLWFGYDAAYVMWMTSHPVHEGQGWQKTLNIRLGQLAVLVVAWALTLWRLLKARAAPS